MKTVVSHSKDKPWITSEFKSLVQQRQKALNVATFKGINACAIRSTVILSVKHA